MAEFLITLYNLDMNETLHEQQENTELDTTCLNHTDCTIGSPTCPYCYHRATLKINESIAEINENQKNKED